MRIVFFAALMLALPVSISAQVPRYGVRWHCTAPAPFSQSMMSDPSADAPKVVFPMPGGP